MKYYFKPSFIHLFKKLDKAKQKQAIDSIERLKSLFGLKQNYEGLGLKCLIKNIWEIRITIKDRIVFSLEKNTLTFILIGSHDDINRFLKNL